MAFAQSLMVLILIVSFGVLAAVFIFWINAGKLVQDTPKESSSKDKASFANSSFANSIMDYTARWETTIMMR
jgi:predicted permease